MKLKTFGRTRQGRPIAAWLLKANPSVWDIEEYFARSDVLDDWRLAESYRCELMEPGQLCFLWITGPKGAQPVPGIWGAGVVRTEPYDEVGGGDLWLDESERRKPRPFVGLQVGKLSRPVPRDKLRRDPRFKSAEILVQPQMGNPLVLTPDEVAAIADEFDDLPRFLRNLPDVEEDAAK